MRCSNCGFELTSNDLYCNNCGQKVEHDTGQQQSNKIEYEQYCSSCGEAVMPGDEFCSVCGARIRSSTRICPQCGYVMDQDDVCCGRCGYSENFELKNETTARTNGKRAAIIAVSCAAVLVIAGAFITWRLLSGSGDDVVVSDSSVEVTGIAITDPPESSPSASPAAAGTEVQNDVINTNTEYSTYYVVNCKENISIRKSPNTKAQVIVTVPLGAEVSYVRGADNGFAEVIYKGQRGYALQSYLSVYPPTPAPPTPTPVPPTPTPAAQAPKTDKADTPKSGGVVASPSYKTYSDADYSFSCAYPSHFVLYNEDNAFVRYSLRAPDNTAEIKICATNNKAGLSPQTVRDNFVSTYPGSIDYKNLGDDWCVIRTLDSGKYHYGYFKLSGGKIRGFEFHFDAAYFDIYDSYINDIYDKLILN